METARANARPTLSSVSSRRWSHPAIFALGIVLAGTLAVGLLQGPRPFYADSEGYWALSEAFTQNGHFSLLNFYSPLRGYTLPLIIYVLRLFAASNFDSQSLAATLFNVALFASIGAILAPELAEVSWPGQRWGVRRRVALAALLLIFWSGDLSYPLTDFPGLAAGLLALVAVARYDSPGWMLLAGAAAGVTLNLRPAYLPLVLMLFVIVALAWLGQRGKPHASIARRAVCVSLLVAGFAAVSLPQSLATYRFYSSWSFIPGSSSELAEEVLTKGMYAQRWDSYEVPGQPPNAIDYVDESGRRLLDQQPGHTIKDTSQYIGVVLAHPNVMVPLLIRHVIDGLDARYSTIYVEHYDSGGHILLRLGGFALVFLALVRLLWPAARRRLGPARWRYPIALSLCCVTAIPSAIETRYMLPLYLLSYMLVLTPGWPNPIGPAQAGWRRFQTPAVLAAFGLLFTALVWHVVGNIPSHPVHPVP
jgi:hypothetical protein